MKLRSPARLAAGAALVGLMVIAATPAFAQTTTAGGSLTTVLQNFVNLMNNGVTRLLGIAAVITMAIVWLAGHIDLRRMAAVVVGIAVMFSAAGIVDLISGGTGA
jgi:type IV secretory pathway VirB2 component (pilin)